MSTIHLALPEPIQQFVEDEAARGGFHGPGDYIQSVLRDLQTRKARERLDEALLEGLDSPSSELRAEEWAEMRREALEQLATKSSP